MGLFKKTSKSNGSDAEVELFKYLGREIVSSYSFEYKLLESSIEERTSEGLTGEEFEKHEQEKKTSLETIAHFLNRAIGNDFSQIRPEEKLWPNWVDLKLLTENRDAAKSGEFGKLEGETLELIVYYDNSAKSGLLHTMPHNPINNSLSYRSYLLGNNLNGKFGWGWELQENSQQKTDYLFTHLISRFLTSVHDKAGRNRVLDLAVSLSIQLLFAWENSPEREANL
jgi:hypothetical protein